MDSIQLVDKDGSPMGSRRYLLWNPKERLGGNGHRDAYITDGARIAGEVIRGGARVIGFTKVSEMYRFFFLYHFM